MIFKYKSELTNYEENNRTCRDCKSNTLQTIYSKMCPSCNRIMYYKSNNGLKKSILKNNMCRRCISKNFVSPMSRLNYVFTDEHRNKIGIKSSTSQLGKKHSEIRIHNMIEGLTGLKYDDYINSIPLYKRYRKKVDSLSHKNNLDILENFGMPEYCLDHIFPVKLGFKYNIDESIISNIDNLRFIPKLENLSKSYKLINYTRNNIIVSQ